MMPKNLPPNLTTLDFIKAAALIAMTFDHVGAYLFTVHLHAVGDPALWLRVIGRLCVPIWFFLIGYARTRTVDAHFLGWTATIFMAQIVMGNYVFPLSVLFNIIFIRLTIDYVTRFYEGSDERRVLVLVMLTALIPFTYNISEYGTLGYILALAGHEVRRQRLLSQMHLEFNARATVLFGFLLMGISQAIFFPFSWEQDIVMWLGMIVIATILCRAEFVTYPNLHDRLGFGASSLIRLLGRRTLEIYVIQHIVLKSLSWYLWPDRGVYGWFDWEWMPGSSMGIV